MDLGLERKVALITGSSDGIGEEIALSLFKEGVHVIVHGKNTDKVRGVCKRIRETSPRLYKNCIYEFVADVTKPGEIKTFFEKRMLQSQLDILVNNVGGIVGIKKFEEISDEEWYDAFTLNLMASVRFIREALPYLKKSEQGRIINIGSAASLQPGVYNPHYLAVKMGLVTLSKYLSRDLAEFDILVNTVCPNTIKGGAWFRDIKNMADNIGLSLEEAAQQLEESVKKKVPLGRVGTMTEVANVVVFLASKAGSFINGECIIVDGGTKGSIF